VPAATRFVDRTLWCRGAPTRTCCGVIQGVKLRGQCRTACQPQRGSWLGETWKVEEHEDPIRARQSEAAKEADRPLLPTGGVGRTAGAVFAGGGTRMSHRARGSNLPMTHLHPDQLGKPHGPHFRVVSRPRGRGTGQGAEDAGESEGRPVIGRIGQYPSRKGADFRQVSPKRCC
jgi:hypothetical protein